MQLLQNYGMCAQTILKLQQVSIYRSVYLSNDPTVNYRYGFYQCKCFNIRVNILAPERDFLPNMDDYFAEATEQLDPANQVEDQYK